MVISRRETEEAPSLFRRHAVPISALVLAGAALMAYANSFSVPLLFDDWVTILNNPRLRQLWPLWSALSPPEATGVGGRPIANLSFVLNYALTGESVPGFHAVNLAIHFLAGLTLFGIVRRTLQGLVSVPRLQRYAAETALVASAWWMLHPVQTQSVTYISQRTESLMGLCFCFTLYAFIRGAEGLARWRWFGAAVLGCFAGMATKEGMVVIPLVVLLYDYAFVARSFREAWQRRWAVYVSLAASWLLLAALTRGLHGRGVGFGHGLSWWSYLLIECRAIITYLSLSFWPAPLVFDYGFDFGTPGLFEVSSTVALVALGGATLVALVRAPAVGFLGAWFFLTLAPTSSVVPIPLQPISENRIYVPTAAVIVALVVAVQYYGFASRRIIALLIAAAALAVTTAARNRDYRSEIAIWADTVAKRPASARAHSNLGHALQARGQLVEARRAHEIALQLRPNYSEAHTNLASIAGQLGDVEAALDHSRRAIAIDPRNANAYYNLGVALTQKGDTAEAIAAYQACLRFNPDMPAAQSNLAVALLNVGRLSEAITHSSTALRLQPDMVAARHTLACALALSGRNEEAVPLFQEVVRVQPTHLDAHRNLGTVLLQLGRAAEALTVFDAALRLNPKQPAVLFGQGNALLLLDRPADAIAPYEALLKLDSQLAEVHQNLGLALEKSGRADRAVMHLETAVRLNAQLKAAAEALARIRAKASERRP